MRRYARALTSGGRGIGAAARAGPASSVASALREASAVTTAVDRRNIGNSLVHRQAGIGKAEGREPEREPVELGHAVDGPEPYTIQGRFALQRRENEGRAQAGRMQPLDHALRIALLRERRRLQIQPRR